MKRSKVQFQKGISLQDFIRQYGQEEQCQQAVFLAKWPHGWICPQCGAKEFYELASRPVYQRKQCHRQTSLIADTIFAATKLPLTTWFFAMFFMTQAKEGIAALNLRHFLNISDRAALRTKHKLQLVMKNDVDKLKLSGLIVVDDVYHGGRSQGGKRGRGAPGKSPIIAALSRNAKGYPIYLRLSRVKAFSCESVKTWAEQYLDPQSLVVFDGLVCFNSLTHGGHIHFVRTTGDNRDPVRIKPFYWLNIIIGNAKNAIRGTYHGVSKQHISRYLAEFSYRFNHRFRLELMVPALIKLAAESKPIPQHQLRLAEDWS
jgi:hypothetical protein